MAQNNQDRSLGTAFKVKLEPKATTKIDEGARFGGGERLFQVEIGY